MTDRVQTPGEKQFWALASPLLRQPGVTRSTMMGFACLRLDGGFFATCDHRTGDLVVKLNEQRVSALVDAGLAEPFAPNGRRFREWASIPLSHRRRWSRLLDDALELAATRKSGRSAPARRRVQR